MNERKRFCLLSDGQIMDTFTRDCDVLGDYYIETMMVGSTVYVYKKIIIKQANTIDELIKQYEEEENRYSTSNEMN